MNLPNTPSSRAKARTHSSEIASSQGSSTFSVFRLLFVVSVNHKGLHSFLLTIQIEKGSLFTTSSPILVLFDFVVVLSECLVSPGWPRTLYVAEDDLEFPSSNLHPPSSYCYHIVIELIKVLRL